MKQQLIGVLGASSSVGTCLLACELTADISLVAFSRQKINPATASNVIWKNLNTVAEPVLPIKHWICLAPIWVLADYFSMLESHGIKRIVALSSTSRFTKTKSSDHSELQIVTKLIQAEQQLEEWAQQRGIEWVILRPTLIYGWGRDKNVSTIIAFIKRFGFFPLFGTAKGKRQPIHLDDVATACLLALNTPTVVNQAYNISGAETLAYDEMVKRIFIALNKKPCFVRFPLSIFRLAIKILHRVPKFKNLTVAMAERMNQDLVFDSSAAKHDFNFEPSAFRLEQRDLV